MEDMEQYTNERPAEAVHTEASASHTSPHNPKKSLSAVLKWALILAIIVVVNVFFASVIQLAYPSPEYNDFCPDKQVYTAPDTAEECVSQGGQWTENAAYKEGVREPSATGYLEPAGYCNPDYTCSKEYDEVRKGYERNVFMLWVAFGIVLILLSVFIAHMGAISLGFSLGGVISLIVGAMSYWSDMDAWLRVIVLGIALVALIVLGIKKFKD